MCVQARGGIPVCPPKKHPAHVLVVPLAIAGLAIVFHVALAALLGWVAVGISHWMSHRLADAERGAAYNRRMSEEAYKGNVRFK